jgi:hypothetical protein
MQYHANYVVFQSITVPRIYYGCKISHFQVFSVHRLKFSLHPSVRSRPPSGLPLVALAVVCQTQALCCHPLRHPARLPSQIQKKFWFSLRLHLLSCCFFLAFQLMSKYLITRVSLKILTRIVKKNHGVLKNQGFTGPNGRKACA